MRPKGNIFAVMLGRKGLGCWLEICLHNKRCMVEISDAGWRYQKQIPCNVVWNLICTQTLHVLCMLIGRNEFNNDVNVIKWKYFPRYWPFVRGIHQSPVNSTHKGQRRGSLMFSLICAWINGWVNNHEAGDLRRNRAHYDVTVINSVLLLHT